MSEEYNKCKHDTASVQEHLGVLGEKKKVKKEKRVKTVYDIFINSIQSSVVALSRLILKFISCPRHNILPVSHKMKNELPRDLKCDFLCLS